MKKSHITVSAEETILLGQKIASEYPETPLFLISGDFGVGKTTFIKGLATGLLLAGEVNVPEKKKELITSEIKSPSFTLVNEYPYREKKVYHADFYRLNSEIDLDFIDFDEVLANEKNRVIIEWFDKISLLDSLQASFPHVILEVRFLSDFERTITLYHS